MARNPFTDDTSSKGRKTLAKAEAALAGFGGIDAEGGEGRRTGRELRQLQLDVTRAKRALSRIERAERARFRAQGKFDVGIGARLPGVNDDGPDIIGGPIIGNVNAASRRSGTVPFTAALINGLF